MASESVSLVIIFCILLGSHCLLSRSSAAQILADDDHSRIGVGGSPPKQDGSWKGNSSPSGTILLSPPASLHHIALATINVTSNGTNSNQNPRHP
ncbi:hypothetical protein EUGRSUZ_G02371 [Eucalyptus grandis]|uniref:Uncharacterized protein n=2 Tax=Eucalyptus grandis TaxID=71139 RepID=A0ACC3K733_EUCGR|nr:hypothetical protein EUGRSUZ_G02371 [Eucalyptus grandis]